MGKNNRKRRAEKKRKVRKSRRGVSNKANTQIAPVLSEMPNPFEGMTKEDREALLTKVATKGREEVAQCFEDLINIIKTYEPLNLLSMLACYGLTVFISDDGVESTESAEGLQQAHVELFQALVLSVPLDALGKQPVTPDVVQKVFDSLLQLMSSFSASRMQPVAPETSEADQAIGMVQELLRGHTQMVRNWGYHSQQNTIPKELYGYFDELLVEQVGFSATNTIDVFNALSQTVEQRLSERIANLSSLRNAKGNYELLLKYHELIGQGREEADETTEERQNEARGCHGAGFIGDFDVEVGVEVLWCPARVFHFNVHFIVGRAFDFFLIHDDVVSTHSSPPCTVRPNVYMARPLNMNADAIKARLTTRSFSLWRASTSLFQLHHVSG